MLHRYTHPNPTGFGDVATGLAHEFNNLLGAIQGFADLIVEEGGKGSLVGRHAGRIIDAGRSGMALVEQLALASGHCRLDRKAFDLSDWIRAGVADLADTQPPHVGLRLDDVPSGMVVDGDWKLLKRALASLCLNAFESLEGRAGNIALDILPAIQDGDVLSLVTLGERSPPWGADLYHDGDSIWAVSGVFRSAPDGWACVRVTDTGTGMDGEVLGRAFDPFFGTRQKALHTGLGLPAACGITVAHGGGVVVSSAPGHGTTARLVLPLRAP